MANHSYVKMPIKIAGEAAEQLLREIVNSFWGDKVVVQTYVGPDAELGRLSWDVHIPDSALPEASSARYWKAPEDDFGFVVWYHTLDASWEFRHPPNGWERWAQDKVQHTIARKMGVLTYEDDGTANPMKVDPEELRDTYYQYITRNFTKPYSADDVKWFERCMSYAPKGFRE